MDGSAPESSVGAAERGVDREGGVAQSDSSLRRKHQHYLVRDVVRKLLEYIGANARRNIRGEFGGSGKREVICRDCVAEKNSKGAIAAGSDEGQLKAEQRSVHHIHEKTRIDSYLIPKVIVTVFTMFRVQRSRIAEIEVRYEHGPVTQIRDDLVYNILV